MKLLMIYTGLYIGTIGMLSIAGIAINDITLLQACALCAGCLAIAFK